MLKRLRKKINHILDLHYGKQHEVKIIEDIKRQAEFRGSNIWMLICASLLTAIGLHINSVVILVGAMLISPLMGPIIGIGLSLGIHDTSFLKKSMRNFVIVTVVTIAISALFFSIAPQSNDLSQLLLRTVTTPYDILIAFICGLAGIVALTRAEKDTIIAGVAIATALILPLATIGFGIATVQPVFVYGAFHLYGINCVFIGLATFIGVTYLKLPHVEQSHTHFGVTKVMTLLLCIPALYLIYANL